ncbi:MAG: long-chain fatty acid--CoA ligase [Bacteroidota bacterium]
MSIPLTRIFDIPYYQLENHPQEVAFASKSYMHGTWDTFSTEQYIEHINIVSRGLLRLGVKPGDKIALISNNRHEWNMMDMGILQIGAVGVPVYPTISQDDYKYIFNHSEVKYCFVSCEEIYLKVKAIRDDVPTLKEVFSFNLIPEAINWKSLLRLGSDDSNQGEVEQLMASVKPNDMATIIYTSGTTGRPKGVMLSHNNLLSNAISSNDRLPKSVHGQKALSFLPVCHVFERMVLYMYQYSGMSIYFAESIDTISKNLQEVKPQVMTAVPRLLEKVYDKIYSKGSDLTGIKKRLFFWAVDLGLEFEPYGANGAWYEFKLSLARKLIFSKWQEALGSNLELIISGSAPLQQRLQRLFTAAGILVAEGYGLSETSPVTNVNEWDNKGWRIGTVGRALDGVDIKIADDGEILIKGPNVMLGYYKDPEKTKEVINGDKYFHTGDIGEIDSDGFLKITDRKKEMFKTSGGKYIAPAVLENAFKESRFIEQIMVIGEGEKMPAALVQLDFAFIREWCKRKKIECTNDEMVITNPVVIDRIQQEIDEQNKNFGKWEMIKKFEIVSDVWSITDGQLTPTMKLKRKVIKQMYKDLFDKIYERN